MMNPRRELACNFSKGGNDPLQRSKLFIVDLPRDISYRFYRNVIIFLCAFFKRKNINVCNYQDAFKRSLIALSCSSPFESIHRGIAHI